MAFDMKAVLDDFVRFMDRQKRAAESAAAEVRVGCCGAVAEMMDRRSARAWRPRLTAFWRVGGVVEPWLLGLV